MANSLSDLHMHHSNTSRLQFNELLISCVENRPAIWDASHPEHKNARRLAQLWDEIGGELKTAVKIVVERWRNLRDTYRKQLRKINHACQNGDGEIPRVRWMHFEQMSFLIPSLTNNRSSGGGSNPCNNGGGGGGLHHNAICIDEPNMEIELPEHLRDLEASDGDIDQSVDNIFEMVEPILNNHSPTGSSLDGRMAPSGTRMNAAASMASAARSNSSGGSSSSDMTSMTPPLLHHIHHNRHQHQQPMTTTSPSKRKRRADTAAAASGRAHLELMQENARHLQMINHQLDACLHDKPDPIEAFLYSLAPSLRATPPLLLPNLKINLIYLTTNYSQGIEPKKLLQIDKINEH